MPPVCCQQLFATPPMLCVFACLQGRIKGSYTPVKMMEFCMLGTLSPTQLLLGIDHNLPYLARQVMTSPVGVDGGDSLSNVAGGWQRFLGICSLMLARAILACSLFRSLHCLFTGLLRVCTQIALE